MCLNHAYCKLFRRDYSGIADLPNSYSSALFPDGQIFGQITQEAQKMSIARKIGDLNFTKFRKKL
jgi:hypothetical protein